jgi:hypothetical protein
MASNGTVQTLLGFSQPCILVSLGSQEADTYKGELSSLKGFSIGDAAKRILQKITFPSKRKDLMLALVTLGELGCDSRSSYETICAAGIAQGLALCPIEVGPPLRLAYIDQPLGQWLVLAVDIKRLPPNDQHVFRLGNVKRTLWISGCDPNEVTYWHEDTRFVFVFTPPEE